MIMKEILKKYLVGFLILFAGIMASCNHNTFYHKSIALPNETWNMDSILVYEFTILDSLQFYNFYIDVRNTTDYPFQNLYFFFTMLFPDGTQFVAPDPLNCILSDSYGRWKGNGSGRIKANRLTFRLNQEEKVRFPQTGTYTILVQHAMREVDLKGITDFGITLQYE